MEYSKNTTVEISTLLNFCVVVCIWEIYLLLLSEYVIFILYAICNWFKFDKINTYMGVIQAVCNAMVGGYTDQGKWVLDLTRCKV